MITDDLLVSLAKTVTATISAEAEGTSEFIAAGLYFAERLYLSFSHTAIVAADADEARALLIRGIGRMRDDILTYGVMDES